MPFMLTVALPATTACTEHHGGCPPQCPPTPPPTHTLYPYLTAQLPWSSYLKCIRTSGGGLMGLAGYSYVGGAGGGGGGGSESPAYLSYQQVRQSM